MLGIFSGLLEDIEGYQGKNGFGANLVLSSKIGKKTKRLEFRTKSEDMFNLLERKLDENIILVVETMQNNFGLRFGDIVQVCDDFTEVNILNV